MNARVPNDLKAQYARIVRNNGRAFADQWLANRRNPGRRQRKVQRARSGPRRAVRAPGVLLSECATKYARLLADPFVPNHSACLPIPPTFKSEKLTVAYKGTLETGTAGYGFVGVRPSHGLVSDSVVGWYSDAAFAGTAFDPSVGTGKNSFNGLGLTPYVTADIAPDAKKLQYRLVAAGLRVKYVGTELERGGTIVGMREPNNGDLTAKGPSSFLTYDQVHFMRPGEGNDDGWVTCEWCPVTPLDYDYATALSGDVYPMAFIVQSASAGTSVSYVFELYTHFEIIGSLARGKTESHDDVTAAKAIIAAKSPYYGADTATPHATISEMLNKVAEITLAGTRVAAAAGAAAVVGRNLVRVHTEL